MAATRLMPKTGHSQLSVTFTHSLMESSAASSSYLSSLPFKPFSSPLILSIRVFKSFPLNEFLVFWLFTLLFVRNPNLKYVRFNAMQALALDVLLVFIGEIVKGEGLGGREDSSGDDLWFNGREGEWTELGT
ncbi:hypothetical protein Tsubulata_002085 [Turnera subulata]|uniref:Protein TIC 20 n=1 Tax=Turnera subulata TaxID=218843 RepID=A0A9Q0G3K3_9ROSI|nr:hypothetical protein Tsubulata_002085 [Turnera subulata]